MQCGFDTPACDLTTCGIGTEAEVDFEACGCTDCVNPIIQCFDNCLPPCLDTVVDPFVECMATPECYGSCLAKEESEAEEVVFPPLEKPDACTIVELFNDPVPCLFPIFPTCDAVQIEIVDLACDAINCCPVCHAEMVNIFDCFYNWASGYACTFTCPAKKSNVRHERDLLREAAPKQEENRRKIESTPDPDFVDECRQLISRDLLEQPENVVGAYMDCIVSNTLAMVTAEANKPKETAVPTMSSDAPSSAPSSADALPQGSSIGIISTTAWMLLVLG